MRIRFIASNYPSAANPTRGTFAREIVEMLRAQGERVDVLAPEKLKGRALLQPRRIPADGTVLAQPRFPTFSNWTVNGVRTASLSLRSFRWAAMRAERRLAVPDIYIGHFLFPSAAAAVSLASQSGVPAVALLDESNATKYLRDYGERQVERVLRAVDGAIAVNEALADFAVRYGKLDSSRILIAENGCDITKFRPLDRTDCRRRLGIDHDGPLVVFVGGFIERKGPLRLLAALQTLPSVKGLFVGRGPQQPHGSHVIDARPYPHESMPVVLGAADVFALPSYAEGCCNAVLEALACGKPVVCGPAFGPGRAIQNPAIHHVDPHDPEAIAAAVMQALHAVQTNPAAIGRAARDFAVQHSLQRRVERMRAWMAARVPASS